MSSVRIIINAVPMPPVDVLRKFCEQYGKIYTDTYINKRYVVVFLLCNYCRHIIQQKKLFSLIIHLKVFSQFASKSKILV